MKIYSNGKDRVIKGDFPSRFKLLNAGVEVPFIRTGKQSVRLSGNIPFGELDVEEIVRKKVPQPAKLDAESIAIINKKDFEQIDILSKKLTINQEQMSNHLSELTEQEATLANLETQNAQAIDQTNLNMVEMAKAFGKEIQADRDALVATSENIKQVLSEKAEVLDAKLQAHEVAKNPHKITKETVGLGAVDNTSDLDKPVSKATQKALEKKADKSDIENLDKRLLESDKKQDTLMRNLETVNLYGGVGGNELPTGGKKGQVLTKKTNKDGDYEWSSTAGGVTVHNDLTGRSVANTHPISAITGLQDALTSETTNRENADNGLQSQIDAITASSDVKDIVGTYAQLQAYDTSTLGNNDIIKVLQDETHSDETTYYRWSTVTETFTLIGEEGPYYTKAEADSTFVPKTRTVNGKALSTDISLTYSDVGAQQAGSYVTTNTVQTITEAKTFTKAVHFTGTGDTNAVFLTENTRFDIEGTTRTILGMGSAQFYINHSDYALLLRGKNARPSYNSATSYLALLSDLDGYVPTTRTVNGKALSSNISLTASDVGALPDSTVIPTVNDATLTIQKNGTDVATFTANSSTNQTANITVPTDTSDLSNGAGFITGITSGDVTTALGYTPYDASNPNGYTSNTGTVTSVNNVSPVNGNVTLTLPDPLPSQTGQSGKFLTTDGTDASWGLPKTHNLFDFIWRDAELNDIAWLRADTFSWQDGTVYSEAYGHLVDDISGKTATSETVGSYTISYYLADDGHKITTDEATVVNIYNEVGIAWYYVLDTANQRFKLPRTKYSFVGLRDTVGKYVPAGLPNITGGIHLHGEASPNIIYSVSGAFSGLGGSTTKYRTATSLGENSGASSLGGVALNASRSSGIYGNSTTVQPSATQMYLYFYVGQFSQSATEQTAGLNSSLFNDKVDLNAQNLSSSGKSLIASLGMASPRHIDLTLGVSGTYYTAPANGYFSFSKVANGNQWANLINSTSDVRTSSSGFSGEYVYLYIPVKKGDVVYNFYTLSGTTEFFKFIYAEGDKNV